MQDTAHGAFKNTGTAPRLTPFCLAAAAILAAASFLFHTVGFTPLPASGPPARTAEAARSLWRTGRLDAPEYYHLGELVAERAKRGGRPWGQDAFTLGQDGRFFPKHTLLSVIAGAPFFGLLGEAGFWIAQQLAALLLFYFVYRISSELCRREVPWLTLFACALLTQTLISGQTFFYSQDLHGAMLVMGALFLMPVRPLWGGWLGGLSLLVRPAQLLLLPFVIAAWPCGGRRDIFDRILGAAGGGALFLLANYLMFGSPWVTAYQRLPAFDPAGAVFIASHPIGFSWEVLLSEWRAKLFDPAVGVVLYNPGLLLLPLVIWQAAKSPARRFMLITLAGALLYGVYIFSYEHWHASFIGNRLLMPAICLYLVNLVVFLNTAVRYAGARRAAAVGKRI